MQSDRDIVDFLAPIAPTSPAGRSVRYERDYALIEEARREENAALPQGVWVRDVKRADWAEVERLCSDVLIKRSKDLRVACWLAEAWLQREGVAGLGRGLSLLDKLCQRYWRDLYPPIEDGDAEARFAPLEWLNRRAPAVINLLPLVADPDQPERNYSWAAYLGAERLEHIRMQDAAAAQRSEERGAVTLAEFNTCQARTDSASLKALLAELRGTRTQLGALEATLTQACGREAPGLGGIRGILLDLEAFVTGVLREREDAAPVALASLQAAAPPPPVEVALAAAAPSALTRDLAYAELLRIADFLALQEPHSPTPLVLREVAGWGQLSLPQLQSRLQDAGSDVSVLLQVLGLGIDP